MKAIVRDTYGPPDVLELRDLPEPSEALTDHEILIEVHATSVTTAEWRLRAAAFPPGFGVLGRLALGWSRPRNPHTGRDFAGRVLAVGPKVTRFQPNDEVFGVCPGANRERLRLRESDAVVRRPSGLGPAEAAALPFGAITALHFLRHAAKVQAGERVLLLGASGGVGTYAVQVAKWLGAEVTGVASGTHLDFVRSLGADHVIDYTTADPLADGRRYDVVVDIAGATRFAQARRVLTAKGRHVIIAGTLGDLFRAVWTRLTPGPTVISGVAEDTPKALSELSELVEAEAIRPVVGHRFAMDQVIEAHRVVDRRRRTGAVIVDFPAAAHA